SVTLPMLWPVAESAAGLERALEALQRAASAAIAGGANIVILSDRGLTRERAAIPSLLATAAVHHHLVRRGEGARCGLVVETGDAREVHHMCLLIGYGAGAVNPWVAFETLDDMIRQGILTGIDHPKAVKNYIKALNKGILKVMAKMGISTLQSYCGAQIFEAVGLNRDLVDRYFTGTASRVSGIGIAHGPLGEGARVPAVRLLRDQVDADARHARRGPREVTVHEVAVQADGLEDLGAAVALQRLDPHLRHDLQDPLVERLDVIRHGLPVIDPGEDPLADHVVQALEGHPRVHGARAIPDEQARAVDLARVARLHDEPAAGPLAAPHEVVVHRGGGQEARNRGPLAALSPIGQDD